MYCLPAVPVRLRPMDASLLTKLVAVALVLVYVLAIVSALEAIIKARTAQGAVAWTISLLTLPYITVPLYLVFGRNKFDGYLEQRDEIEQESLRLIRETSSMVALPSQRVCQIL